MSLPRRVKRWVLLCSTITILTGCGNFLGLSYEGREESRQHAGLATGRSKAADNEAKKPYDATSLSASAVKGLQVHLAQLGFDPGPDDGILGPRTTNAIKRYQTANRLPATGKITGRLLRHLDREAAHGTGNPSFITPPSYRLGTVFVYSNGRVERVARVEGAEIQWKRQNGTTYSAHKNFLLPWSYWVSPYERGVSKISKPADRVWPAQEGAEVSFSAHVAIQRGNDAHSTDKRTYQWHCKNEGIRKISLQLGKFETVVLTCKRGGNPHTADIVRTWYYAKDVGHYVSFVETGRKGQGESYDLLAVRPGVASWPPIVRAGLKRTIAYALETADTGSRIPWTSSRVKVHVSIEPKSRFVFQDGRSCRRFIQIWSENGKRRTYPAVACKTALGKWEIPGMGDNASLSLANASSTH